MDQAQPAPPLPRPKVGELFEDMHGNTWRVGDLFVFANLNDGRASATIRLDLEERAPARPDEAQ